MSLKTLAAAVSIAALPALGTEFEGGIFAGITTTPDGTHAAVVLLLEHKTDVNWKDAKAWAEECGGQLPTRPVAALLFANVKSQLKPHWHWTADEEGASSAWFCNFYHGGGQFSGHRSCEGAAVAVRLIPLTA